MMWTVGDVMTRDVITVSPETTYREVVDTLVEHAVSAVPVVDASGHVLGVVSEGDLLHKVEAVDEQRAPLDFMRPSRRIAARKAHGAVASEFMTAPPVTIVASASVVEAARELEAREIKRLPVTDENGRLVGIISRRDVLRMHTRTDADISRDIVDTVLVHTLWIDPHNVHVDVKDGRVTLDGQLETRSLTQFAVRLSSTVPGVVDVTDRLRWERDDSAVINEPGYQFGSPERLLRPSGDADR